MNKEDLVNLLKELNIPISESTPQDSDMDAEVRVCYWDYIWDDIIAGGTEYNTNVTYQVSVIADRPRHPKLLELKRKLNEAGIFPTIQHESLTEKRRIHSFFSIEVLENLNKEEK